MQMNCGLYKDVTCQNGNNRRHRLLVALIRPYMSAFFGIGFGSNFGVVLDGGFLFS